MALQVLIVSIYLCCNPQGEILCLKHFQEGSHSILWPNKEEMAALET